jgi:membrane-associated HD superfamily phosphohydrolase
VDQSGPGIQALKRPLIIHYSTARHPLTRLRDSVLFLLCWAMWSVVLTAVVNSTEWEALGISIAGWLGAHLAFFQVLMASFHFPSGYASMVIILICAFLIWSNLGVLLSAHAHHGDIKKAALSLEELVRHFGLDSATIGAMQHEMQVIVFHAPCGAVIGVRRAHPEAAAGVDAPPLHLVV